MDRVENGKQSHLPRKSVRSVYGETRNAKSLCSFKRLVAKFDFSNFLVNF